MINIIKATVAKLLGNVTQSVVSAIIVFFITTYLLVDFRKKDPPPKGAGTDSLKQESIVPLAPKRQPDVKTSPKRSTETPVERMTERKNAQEQKTVREDSRRIAIPVDENTQQMKSPLPQNHPNAQVEKKLETTVVEARAKVDTLAKNKKHPEVKKEQKHVDDVFDELDQEAGRKMP